MVYAQISSGIVRNTILLNDASLLSLFQNDPSGTPYDYVLQIDQIYPRPGINWTFDGIVFAPPNPSGAGIDGDGSDSGGSGGGGGLLGGLL